MYESYFGLTERPFSIAPDPQYLYMADRHKEAMAHLSYGLSQGGCFIVLTGEVGTGKTTLCRNLMTDLPDHVDLALILNANINEEELLQTICDELKVAYTNEHSQKQLLDLINRHLLSTFANNRHTVLIIDEAQLLSRDVLEQIRLLTNLETTKHKLLQIILIGQPELSDMLMRNDLRQLAQRVTARYHLGELKKSEIEEYVNYRLSVAGCKQPLFSSQALTKLHQLTDGIPRKINVLADHALLSTYSQNKRLVDANTIKDSAKEVFFTKKPTLIEPSISNKRWWILALALLLINAFLWWYFSSATNNESANVKETIDPITLETEGLVSEPSASNEPSASTQPEPTTGNQPLAEIEALPGIEKILEAPTPTLQAVSQNSSLDSTSIDVALDELVPDIPSEDVFNPELIRPDVGVNIATGEPDLVDANLDVISAGSVVLSEEYLDVDDDIITDSIDSVVIEGQVSDVSVISYPLLSEQTEFGRILETSADLTGRISTFRNLVELWGVELPDQIFRSMCDEAQASGLQCVFFNGWDQLLRFNRPTVLVLNHNNQLHRVIVEVVDGDAAEVRVGDSIYRISVAELQSRWQGNEAVLVWRPNEIGADFLKLGDISLNLPDIRRYLNQALAQSKLPSLVISSELEFDRDLAQKLFSLQTAYKILPDRKIGNETYLLMNELNQQNSTPVLRSRLQF